MRRLSWNPREVFKVNREYLPFRKRLACKKGRKGARGRLGGKNVYDKRRSTAGTAQC